MLNLYTMKRIVIFITALTLSVFSASAVSNPDVKYGPWVQNVTETGFTVMWKSSLRNLSYVEIAPDDGTPFEMCTRPRFYTVVDGRRITDTFHKVEVTGLEPGKTYRYRIYGKVVENDDSAYGTDYGPERRASAKVDAKIKTLDKRADKCRFFMLCDIHAKDKHYKALTKDVDVNNFDFMLMNGDMVTQITEADTMVRHVFDVVPELTSSIPIVYTRGNHETRGRHAHYLAQFCPTPTGKPYFIVRQGSVAFLILDGGEDKPDSDPEYSGTVEFDAYRAAELEWIRKAVKDPVFAEAPLKVAVMHIPALKTPTSWYGQSWLNENFVPALNDAGIDLMLSGHHHKPLFVKVGECGNQFPIIANDDTDRLEFEADKNSWHIRTYDMEGRQTNSYDGNQ